MAVHRVTRILPYAPEQLADLVADERAEGEGVSVLDAEAGVGFSFLKERFSTWVRHDRNAPKVEVGLLRGPFKHLKNRWEFFPHPDGARLEFMIDFAFKSRMLDLMLSANFDRAVEKLIGCFEGEAKRRYGGRGGLILSGPARAPG